MEQKQFMSLRSLRISGGETTRIREIEELVTLMMSQENYNMKINNKFHF